MAHNKINDLRDHLFEVIEKLKDGEIDIDKAVAIKDVAQVIVNSAKVEVDYLKVTDQSKSDSDYFKPVTGDLKKIA